MNDVLRYCHAKLTSISINGIESVFKVFNLKYPSAKSKSKSITNEYIVLVRSLVILFYLNKIAMKAD